MTKHVDHSPVTREEIEEVIKILDKCDKDYTGKNVCNFVTLVWRARDLCERWLKEFEDREPYDD